MLPDYNIIASASMLSAVECMHSFSNHRILLA